MTTTIPETHKKSPPPQEQTLPGSREAMQPKPLDEFTDYQASGKLLGKVAIVTGGDSGIGRATAILFAKEGADVCLVYLNEHEDAENTVKRIRELKRKVINISGDLADETFCADVVSKTISEFKHIDILVNNAGRQDEIKGVEDLTREQVEKTFGTNIFGFFFLTRAVVPHLKSGAAIINTTSIQAYEPSPSLMDYACTKAAILNFTRSLAKQLAEKKIRVNAVAPGPIWTPLIPASFEAEEMKSFGQKTLFKRPGQPAEVAPAYLFFAADCDSSFVTGQVLHVNGGQGMFS
ncbi:MAG TPA: SDR family oxidoreductase [Verrucomicrobiae bacterium]|nr:SDR family oxidoreductase [Verrucomicrobiae bacterium]